MNARKKHPKKAARRLQESAAEEQPRDFDL